MFYKKEIDIRKFEKCKRISKRAFSFTYKVQNKETGVFYAAKNFDCCDDIEICNKVIDRTIQKIMYTNHPTIIAYYWFSRLDFQNENNIVLIMELAAKGSLLDLLQNFEKKEIPPNYTNTTRQKMIIGISRGMKYLHDRNFYNCNLKSSNILLDNEFQPHLADFFKKDLSNVDHISNQFESKESIIYQAPEILTNNQYTKKSDVYSFGIVLYEIISDKQAFTEKVPNFELKHKIVNEKYRPKFDKKINDPLGQLIEQCWSENPNERPTFDELFQKLSNKNDRKKYFLEGVDDKEIDFYVEKISKTEDHTEGLLNKITEIEQENHQLNNVLNEIKIDDKKTLDSISNIEEDFQKTKISNKELITKNKEQLKILNEIEEKYKQLMKDTDDLKEINKQQNNQIEKIEEFHQQVKSELKKI